MPPLPPWPGLHPLVVHFPIALLLAVPILLVASLVARGAARLPVQIAALLILAAGVGAAWLAVETGEAAEPIGRALPGAGDVRHEHEEAGEALTLMFTGLLALYAVIVFVPLIPRVKLPRGVALGANIVFLIAYLACTPVIAITGHLGGRLVHEFGVRAPVTAEMLPSDGAAGETD